MAVKTSRISSIKPVKKFYSLIWFFFFLAALGLSFSLWGLVPWPEIKFRPAALGAWSLSHWTNREVSPWFDSWYSSTFKRPKLGIKTCQFSHSAVSDRLFATPWTTARQAPLSITNPRSPPKPMVHRVGDAIQPSHPLSSPSPPAFNLSQHQGLFQWVSSLHHVVKVLELQLQHQSFQWIFRTDFL